MEVKELENKNYYSIKEAAELLGVETYLLRYWEDELGIKILRTDTGRRIYHKSDIEQFQRIIECRNAGVKLKRLKENKSFLNSKDEANHNIISVKAFDYEGVDAADESNVMKLRQEKFNQDIAEMTVTKQSKKHFYVEDKSDLNQIGNLNQRDDLEQGSNLNQKNNLEQKNNLNQKNNLEQKNNLNQKKYLSQKNNIPENNNQNEKNRLSNKYMQNSKMKMMLPDKTDFNATEIAEKGVSIEQNEKLQKLQELLSRAFSKALEESTQTVMTKVSDEVKETVTKEIDYQFRVRDEKEAEREELRRCKEEEWMKSQEEHFRLLDEMLRSGTMMEKKKEIPQINGK